jgi:hypothetical protein
MRLGSARLRILGAAVTMTLLAAVAVGPPGSDARADEARTTVHRVTVPAAHFYPARSGQEWLNEGVELRLTAGMDGVFIAEIPYDYPGVSHIFITRVEFLAYDNMPTSEVCVSVQRMAPGDTASTNMGQRCTADSPLDPQRVIFNPDVRRVNAGQRAYFLIALGCPGVAFYGARITYTTNP